MWCNVCQSDVAIEVGADHRRVTCSTCGTVLGETAVSHENEQPQDDRVSEARDLLDRWASDHVADPYGPPKKPVTGEQQADLPSARQTPSDAGTWPDPAASMASGQSAASPRLEDVLEPPSTAMRPRWDAPHASVRRPVNLDRHDDGRADRSSAGEADGGVARSTRRPPPADGRNPQLPQSPPERPASPDTSSGAEAERDAEPGRGIVSGRDTRSARGGEPSRDSGLAASAAELDRLTSEILSRVSRITGAPAVSPTAEDSSAGGPSADGSSAETCSAGSSPADGSAAAGSAAATAAESRDPVSSTQPTDAAPSESSALPDSGSVRDSAPAEQPDEPAADGGAGFGGSNVSVAGHAGNRERSAAVEQAAPVRQRPVPRPHAAAFARQSDAAHQADAVQRPETARRVDPSHQVTGPYADFSDTAESAAVAGSDEEIDTASWFGGIGQGLAWLGILGLTAGTSLVIVGYFGGPSTYAPMGWLISTIGQMLLFLGIVTLVSSGMEQTTQEVRRTVNEVSRKLDLIDDRIIRIEAAAPPGPPRPHIADRMVPGPAATEQRTHQDARLR